MARSLLLLFLFSFAATSYSQREILHQLLDAPNQTQADYGIQYCTESFWNADIDGGQRLFERMKKGREGLELRIAETKNGEGRLVYIVDYIYKEKKTDEVYVFMIKDGSKWKLDGFNEAKLLIPHFLDGTVSGHFNPLDLPKHEELEKIGSEILAFGKNNDKVVAYSSETFADGSSLRFSDQLTSTSYTEVVLKATGYSVDFSRGFIFFEQKKIGSSYPSRITLFVKKMEDGKFKITNTFYTKPYVSGFFRED